MGAPSCSFFCFTRCYLPQPNRLPIWKALAAIEGNHFMCGLNERLQAYNGHVNPYGLDMNIPAYGIMWVKQCHKPPIDPYHLWKWWWLGDGLWHCCTKINTNTSTYQPRIDRDTWAYMYIIYVYRLIVFILVSLSRCNALLPGKKKYDFIAMCKADNSGISGI